MRIAGAPTSAPAHIHMSAAYDIRQETTLSAGRLDLVFLPGIGGRLRDIRLDQQSLLFQIPDLAQKPFDAQSLTSLPTRSPQFGFPLWGGEKTWIAPDTDWQGGAPQGRTFDFHDVEAMGHAFDINAADRGSELVPYLAREIFWTVTHFIQRHSIQFHGRRGHSDADRRFCEVSASGFVML